MAKIAKLQKDVDGVLNTIYPSTITEAVINIESSKSLKDELTDINNKIPTKTSDITNDSDYITSSEVDTKINSAVAAVYKVRGSVDNYESLPISNVTVGDVYNLLDTGSNYVCISIDPIIWDKLSETIDLSAYSTTEENDAKYQLKGDYITSIPDEYVTDTELEAKGYATATSVEAALATKLDSSAYTAATSTTSGYMSSGDYIKLSGIEENADVNIIESITVNGYAVSVTDKTAAIEVNETHGVLLDEVPTDTTLTYQDGDKVKSFTIGMSAIYPDTESEDGYSMSFFKGTTVEGKAIWGKGGGGAGSLNETVMISLVSNQDEMATPDADLLGKSVHVIYGDQDKELVWQGETMKTTVPMDMTYQVVFPSDDRYKCPTQQEYIAIAGYIREVKGLYYTEVVKVTVSSDDSSDVTGQQVTINGTQYAWAGTTIEVKIPHDVEYSVSVSAKAGYATPTTVTATAAKKLNEISMQYLLIKVNTITIDQTVSDPATMVSGDINGSVIQRIRNNSHRVLAKKTADGVLTYCQLNDADSTQYYDGTTAALNGTQGDVFLKLPEFYYKGTEGDKVNIMFAEGPIDDEYIRWDPNTLIGVYEAYNGSSKMYSRSGVDSTGNVSQSTWKTYAAARGTGYQLVDWQMHCVMGCLYYATYGNTDCQSSIGKGTNASNKSTGQTDSLGMTDTVAGGNGDSQSINFWGLENWWGNKSEWIHDYDNPENSLSATVNDPVNGGTRSLPVFDYGGYNPKKMKFGRYLDLIATTDDPKNGSDMVGYCDYQWWPGSTNSGARVVQRSSNFSYTNGGVACTVANSTASNKHASGGSRLAFRGSLIEETDVETFKAIAITN